MASCSSHVPTGNDLDTGSEMTFVVSELSRASVTTDLKYDGAKFAIYGDMKLNDNPRTVIFDNTLIRYSSGNWVYDEIQYWFPKHEHSFVAMHPVIDDIVEGISDMRYSDSRLSFSYALPGNYKSATDLIVATHRRLADADHTVKASPIALNFHHIMSRINFRVTNDAAADIVKVTEIKLDGVNKMGSFSIIPAPLLSGKQTDDYDFAWTDLLNKGNLSMNIDVDVPENEARPLFPDTDALLMIPQPDNQDVIMHITYTLYDADAQPQELTLTAETPIGGWISGKEYTYNLVISEITKELDITVSVKDWQTPKPTGITVPES